MPPRGAERKEPRGLSSPGAPGIAASWITVPVGVVTPTTLGGQHVAFVPARLARFMAARPSSSKPRAGLSEDWRPRC